nr:hypothetical protein [Pseudomonas aeruginosa]
MKLIQYRLSSGQRVPLLVQDGAAAPLPVLVPFLYVQLQLKHRAVNTAAAHLRAIQAFYVYAESRGLDVDEAILQCRFESILALLDGYSVLLGGRRVDNVAGRIGAADPSLFPRIDLRTRDQYLGLLKRYLAWSATRYLSRTPHNAVTHQAINAAFVDSALPQPDGCAAGDHPCADPARRSGKSLPGASSVAQLVDDRIVARDWHAPRGAPEALHDGYQPGLSACLRQYQ